MRRRLATPAPLEPPPRRPWTRAPAPAPPPDPGPAPPPGRAAGGGPRPGGTRRHDARGPGRRRDSAVRVALSAQTPSRKPPLRGIDELGDPADTPAGHRKALGPR